MDIPNLAQSIKYHQMNIGLFYLSALKYYKVDKICNDKSLYYSDESISRIYFYSILQKKLDKIFQMEKILRK